MAISKIPGAGVSADTLEAGDIAANAIGASELANNAVDTAAIADDAITGGKLANDVAISTSGAITTTGAFTSVGIDDNASGATAITIDSSENVGIGDTTPDATLSILANTTGKWAAYIDQDHADGYGTKILTDNNSTNPAFQIDNSDGLAFRVQDAGNVYAKGSVGIGTTSPSKTLHINGTTMGPMMEGEMIWSKDFTWASNTSPSLTATGLTYGNLGSGGAIYMFHFYWANETLTDSYGYSRMYALYRNDYGGLFASDIERTYGFRSGTAGFQGYPYISNPGTSDSGTTVTLPFQNTGGGSSSYNAIMYVSVHKIHCDSLYETN